MDEQTKVLETLTKESEDEIGKMNQLNVAVQEQKINIVNLKDQMQTTEQEIQEKQKAKDDMIENSSKRVSMIAYYQKNIKTLNDAMAKYEVSISTMECHRTHNVKITIYFVVHSEKW